MIVTLKDILKLAEAKGCAYGSFNAPNMENAKAIIRAAEALGQPVILMHAEIHDEMGISDIAEVGPMMLDFADRASVPVCVHLDHGTDLDYIKKGLDIGFTSVMFDGSELPEKENYAKTAMVVEMASHYGASVEAEIGSLGSREDGEAGSGSIYTDPDVAKDFAEQTGIDALACAFGTVHGLYHAEPKLDFDRVKKIHSMIDIPIVMHGGSGVSHEDYRKVIACGVRKINYYTYMAKAAVEAIAKTDLSKITYFHDVAKIAEDAMAEDVKKAITVFSGLEG